MPQENVELVRRWIRAGNGTGLEAAMALCDPAFEMTESPTLPGAATTAGLDGVRRYFAGWKRNWSEWAWQEEEVHDIPPDKVLVMALLRLRGLRSGIWVEHRWAYLFTLRDGKLLRQDGFDDKAQALAAVGSRSRRCRRRTAMRAVEGAERLPFPSSIAPGPVAQLVRAA